VIIGELVGEFRGLVEFFGLRLLRDEDAVDQEVEDIGSAAAGSAPDPRSRSSGLSP
jgi:hypothetical protein